MLPGTSGALLNTSYGVFGASGEPAIKPGASGPIWPCPAVFCPMNVKLACVEKCNPVAAGLGDGIGELAGDGNGEGIGCARTPYGTAHNNTPSANAAAAGRTTIAFRVLEQSRAGLPRRKASGSPGSKPAI